MTTPEHPGAPRPERCLHGMVKATCANCAPRRAAREPVRHAGTTPHGAAVLDVPSLQAHGFVVVRTCKGRDHCGIEQVGELTSFVHIDGAPFLWAFEEMLERAPNLKTIQVIPSMYGKLKSHLHICQARGVSVVVGHVRPELAWEEGRIVAPQYALQRRFMLHLGGEQRQLFDELLLLGFESAALASRYYCLHDEDYVPQRLLAKEFGFSEGHNAVVSAQVLAILHYLDDTVEVGDTSKRRAAALRQAVARLRPYLASAERRTQLVQELGVPLATNFPLARVEVFRQLLADMRSGRLDEVLRDHPRAHRALVLRFGLDALSTGVYRKLLNVGEMLDGVTRERARQLEEQGLGLLGIVED